MDIRMVVTDLDGTFLRNDETISQESVNMIKRLQRKGILFVIATSRSMSSVGGFAKRLNPDAIISSGGAQALIGTSIVYEALISQENASKYIKECLGEPAIDYIRVTGEKIDLTNNPDISFDELEFGHYKRTSFENDPKQKVYKISIVSENVEVVKAMFKEKHDCRIVESYAGSNCHKLTHVKATKEDALMQVAAYFGLTYENILSFGDDQSDVMMLSLSKVGVAVNNAKACIKEVADDLCDENENDGVAKYLLEYFGQLLEEK